MGRSPDEGALRPRAAAAIMQGRHGGCRDCRCNSRTGLRDKTQPIFTLTLDEGVSLTMLVEFAPDMFPGISTEDIGVWPRTMVSWWSPCVVAEQLLRIEGCRDVFGL